MVVRGLVETGYVVMFGPFARDREPSAAYDDEGRIFVAEDVWGGAA